MSTDISNGYKVHTITLRTPYEVGDVNVFLLERGDSLVLFDAAADTDECWEALLRAMDRRGFSPNDLTHLLLTHSHPDHIGLVNRITARHEVPVYAHRDAIPRLKRSPGYLSMRVEFFDRLYREMGCGAAGERQVEMLREAVTANEGQMIRADIVPLRESDRVAGLEVLEVPGHAPDHIAFWDAKQKWLFAGDHLLKGISSNAFVEPDYEGRRIPSLTNYVRSLKKCRPLRPARVYAAHGELIDDAESLIYFRTKRIGQKAEIIRSMVGNGMTTADEIARSFYGTKYDTVFFAVMSEIIGLLDFLEGNGEIEGRKTDGLIRYSVTEGK